MNDLITIGMPVYKAEKYVERSMLSALNQTYKNIEYLIVDDKGNDNSIAIIENIASTHLRGEAIKIITHPENLGIGEGRNTIIKSASGKYLFFMDNDDELTVDCIQKLYDEMIRVDVDVVCGSCNEVKGMVITPYNQPGHFVERDKTQILLSYFNQRIHIPSWNKLYKLSFLRENQILFHHQFVDDHYFTLQTLLNADSYSVIPDITYLYHRVPTSTSLGGECDENSYKDWTLVFKEELKLFQNAAFSPTLRKKIKKLFFAQRLLIANTALRSPYNVRHYINDYLNPAFLKGKDTFTDPVLSLFYLLSSMPLWVKKIYIPLLVQIKNRIKKN